MKINIGILSERVMTKMQNETFSAIVTEAFINAIPLPTAVKGNKRIAKLQSYSKAMLESMGGYKVLESAIETEDDPIKKQKLVDMKEVCDDASAEVTKRVSDEARQDQTLDTIEKEDYVATATFTDEERSKFLERANSLDIEDMSNIIKDKVINTIRDEKNIRNKVEAVNAELEEIVEKELGIEEEPDEEEEKDSSTDEDADDESSEANSGDGAEAGEDTESPEDDEPDEDTAKLESVMTTLLNKNDRHAPKSLFGVITEQSAQELIYKHDPSKLKENIRTDVLENVTFNRIFPSKFPYAKITPESALENLSSHRSRMSGGSLSSDDKSAILNSSMLHSVIVYTALETLHTMNLLDVSGDDIRASIDGAPKLDSVIKTDIATLEESLKSIMVEIQNTAPSAGVGQIEKLKTDRETLVGLYEELTANNASIPQHMTEDIEATITLITIRLSELNDDSYTGDTDNNMTRNIELAMSRAREENIAELLKITSFIRNTTSKVLISVAGDSIKPNNLKYVHLDVTYYDISTTTSFMKINVVPYHGNLSEAIIDAFNNYEKLKINSGTVPIMLQTPDEPAYRLNVN